MDSNNNLIRCAQINPSHTDQIWYDIAEYQMDYVEIHLQREMYRLAFLHRSPEIKHLKDIAITKRLTHCTLHLAVYLLDIFMDNHTITTDRLLLVTSSCLLIAAKIEESLSNLPTIIELNCLLSCQYTIEDYKALEIYVLKYFDWKVMYPTAAHYVHYFLHVAVTKEDCVLKLKSAAAIMREMQSTIQIYLDKVLDDVHYMQNHRPSILSAAIISIAREIYGLSDWHQQLETYTNFTKFDIRYAKLSLLQTLPLPCTDCGTFLIPTEEIIET